MASLFGISSGKRQEKEDAKERWEETADIEFLRKEVQERLRVLLERKGSRNSVTADNQIASLPPFFIDKCLRQRGGLKLQRCAELCVNFLEFRVAEGWPLELSPTDVNEAALRSGFLWLLRDKHKRALIVYNLERLFETPLQRRMRRVRSREDGNEGKAAEVGVEDAEVSVVEFQKMGMYLMEQALGDIEVQRKGAVLVFDCRRISASSFIGAVSSSDAQRGVQMWQDAFPVSSNLLIPFLLMRWLSLTSNAHSNRTIVPYSPNFCYWSRCSVRGFHEYAPAVFTAKNSQPRLLRRKTDQRCHNDRTWRTLHASSSWWDSWPP